MSDDPTLDPPIGHHYVHSGSLGSDEWRALSSPCPNDGLREWTYDTHCCNVDEHIGHIHVKHPDQCVCICGMTRAAAEHPLEAVLRVEV